MLTEPVFGLGSSAFNNAPGSISSLRLSQPVWGMGKGIVVWGRETSLLGSLLNYGGEDYWWEQGCGLRQPLEEPFVLQAGRGEVFVTIPFQAAQIGLLRGGCRVAQEGFAAVGVTEEGAEFGLGWQMHANTLFLL